MFGISQEKVLNANRIKYITGGAGTCKSTLTVTELLSYGLRVKVAAISNALKRDAEDKYGTDTDTICGACFVNKPGHFCFEEKEIVDYDAIVIDEAILFGYKIYDWAENHRGQINIFILGDEHQMLPPESKEKSLKAHARFIKKSYVDYVNVDISNSKRPVDKITLKVYEELYKLPSEQVYTINEAAKLLHADILSIDDISYDPKNGYQCHSNAAERALYRRFDLYSRPVEETMPKGLIARNNPVNLEKYPISDQLSAEDLGLNNYRQIRCVGSPTRFQGREIAADAECYFIVSPTSVFTGRELYTVGTRCKSIKSMHIVIYDFERYNDPEKLNGQPIVSPRRLNITTNDKTYQHINESHIAKIIGEYGYEDEYYYNDYISSGDNIVYSTLPNSQLERFAKIDGDKVVFEKKKGRTSRNLRSVCKKDPTMNFDFMPKVYNIVKGDITPPRIHNKETSKKKFQYVADINSAHETVLHYAPMPKAGFLYEQYDPNLLNFYRYKGDVVTKGSIITEELANKLGNSDYVFSTAKQEGCELGHYTYEQCFTSQEHKDKVHENFKWGILEAGYYARSVAVKNGKTENVYIKHSDDHYELVACALWSRLCLIVLEAIEKANLKSWYVVVDGIYYNSENPVDDRPIFPDYVKYRIDMKDWEDTEKGDKYKNIIWKNYEFLPKTSNAVRSKAYRERQKALQNDTDDFVPSEFCDATFDELIDKVLTENIH